MKKTKRILAWIGIILLVGMYLATFLLSIFDNTASMGMFRASVVCTVLIPVMLYAYSLVYKWTRDKNEKDNN